MKTFFRYLLVVMIGLVLGLGSAFWAIRSSADLAFAHNGVWRTNIMTGSKDLDMYSRVYVAVKYLFAMNKTETIYYEATTDEDGKPLNTDCNYLVIGRAPKARWWSITAYDEDQFLIDNPQNRYAFSGEDLGAEPGEEFKIRLSSDKLKGNWIPTGDGKSLMLLLRLYNPEPEIYDNVEGFPLPKIIREACK